MRRVGFHRRHLQQRGRRTASRTHGSDPRPWYFPADVRGVGLTGEPNEYYEGPTVSVMKLGRAL